MCAEKTSSSVGGARTLPDASDAHVEVQDDGKVVVLYVGAVGAGSCQVTRYAANGSLDETFGDGGKTEIITRATPRSSTSSRTAESTSPAGTPSASGATNALGVLTALGAR